MGQEHLGWDEPIQGEDERKKRWKLGEVKGWGGLVSELG